MCNSQANSSNHRGHGKSISQEIRISCLINAAPMFALTFASSTIRGLQKINDYQSTSSDASKVGLEADALAPPSSNKLCIMSPKEIKRLCIKAVFK